MLLDAAANAGSLVFVSMKDEDGEFVASEPPEDVGLTEALAQNIADFDESAISNIVSESVVDCFEAVDVDESDGKCLAALEGLLQAMVCDGKKAFSVVESGEVIDEGKIFENGVGSGQFLRLEREFLLGDFAGGDIFFKQFIGPTQFGGANGDEVFEFG